MVGFTVAKNFNVDPSPDDLYNEMVYEKKVEVENIELVVIRYLQWKLKHEINDDKN